MMEEILYPNVTVELDEADNRPFLVLMKVATALRAARIPEDEIRMFSRKATFLDFEHLLREVALTVNLINKEIIDEVFLQELTDGTTS